MLDNLFLDDAFVKFSDTVPLSFQSFPFHLSRHCMACFVIFSIAPVVGLFRHLSSSAFLMSRFIILAVVFLVFAISLSICLISIRIFIYFLEFYLIL